MTRTPPQPAQPSARRLSAAAAAPRALCSAAQHRDLWPSAKLVRDPEAPESFPQPAIRLHAGSATAPGPGPAWATTHPHAASAPTGRSPEVAA